MKKDSHFTKDLHSLKKYWEDEVRAIKFKGGGTRTGAVRFLLLRLGIDIHQGSWLDSGTGAGFVQSQIDPDISPTLFVGLDFSIVMLQAQDNPYGARVVGSAFQVPFRKNSFSVVTNIFSLSDYPNIDLAFEDLGRVVDYTGSLTHLDYGIGDEYWEKRKSLHGSVNPDGSIIVGNINLRSLGQVKNWAPSGFRVIFQNYLEFEVEASEIKSTFKLPEKITRRFIMSQFYKYKSSK